MGTAIVKFGAGCAGRADGADDLVAKLDHHAATKKHDMRQLGKWRNRNLALGTLMVTGSGAKALVGSGGLHNARRSLHPDDAKSRIKVYMDV